MIESRKCKENFMPGSLLSKLKTRIPSETADRNNGHVRVLIIEDEPDIAAYLQILLKEYGFEAACETDATRAIAAAETFRPDVICLDMVMPKKTGLTLFMALKKHPELCHIPVVVVSALHPQRDFDDMPFEDFVRKHGIPAPDVWLEKPIDRAAFLETIRVVIGKKRHESPTFS
ncbi:MAG: response regulator [bacterium]